MHAVFWAKDFCKEILLFFMQVGVTSQLYRKKLGIAWIRVIIYAHDFCDLIVVIRNGHSYRGEVVHSPE